MKIAGSIAFWILCGSLAPANAKPLGDLSRFTYSEYHMGVDARIVVYAPSESQAQTACAAAFQRIADLDSIMSDYRKDSELMRLCDRAGGPPVRVSKDLFTVLRRGREISQRSGGAFDMTVGPLVALWRKARKSAALPSPAELQEARSLVGWRMLELNARAQSVQLRKPGMRLDLGGIAKGYACDEAQKVLKRNGIDRALVEMGGDIVVSKAPPETKGWTIRVPSAGKDLPFSNCAVSTSGDSAQSVVIGGVRYSHVVDPRTGTALTNRVEVTVVARDGLTSDPLSTTLTVMGEGERARMLRYYRGSRATMRTLSLNTPAGG